MQANISDLLLEAAILLSVGMTVVFIFLTLLIGAINVIAFISSKFPEPEVLSTPAYRGGNATNKTAANGVSPNVVAAIGAAIHQHRKSK